MWKLNRNRIQNNICWNFTFYSLLKSKKKEPSPSFSCFLLRSKERMLWKPPQNKTNQLIIYTKRTLTTLPILWFYIFYHIYICIYCESIGAATNKQKHDRIFQQGNRHTHTHTFIRIAIRDRTITILFIILHYKFSEKWQKVCMCGKSERETERRSGAHNKIKCQIFNSCQKVRLN